MPLIITLHITDSFMDKSLSSKDTIQNSREGGRGREREREREREYFYNAETSVLNADA